MEFVKFPKIPRLHNSFMRITEKIDGTNAQILIQMGDFIYKDIIEKDGPSPEEGGISVGGSLAGDPAANKFRQVADYVSEPGPEPSKKFGEMAAQPAFKLKFVPSDSAAQFMFDGF